MATEDFEALLFRAVARAVPGALALGGLRRLTGGASRESWAFEVRTQAGAEALILRRTGGRTGAGLPLATEARLLAAAARALVPVPRVRLVLEKADGLGEGYVMDRVEGETIPQKILREERFAAVRPRLARQCGEVLARIHALPRASLPALEMLDAGAQLARYRDIHDGFGVPHPAFEAAFAWLRARLAEVPPVPVHGDFRLGNLIVGPEGIAAVLDWELAHIGDPLEDLGWLCVPSWRFGRLENPAGGLGAREDLIAGYAAAGGTGVDRQRLRFWEVFGSLKWGVMCQMMGHAHLTGEARSLERAAIGRRVSETELDLVLMLRGEMP